MQVIQTSNSVPQEVIRDVIWPNFFIVGAVKCGTTSLWAHLKKHPQVFLPDMKEPHFFLGPQPPPQLGDEIVDQHCAGDEEAYHRLYEGAAGFPAIGDASPSYLWEKDAPRRIHDICPDAKIIIILRDPVVRAHSRYLMNLELGTESLSFREALKRDAARERKLWWTARLYVEVGLYYEQVLRYFDIFGREQVLVLFFDELTRHPQQALAKVTRHLGIDPLSLSDADLSEPFNPYRRQRFGFLYRIATRVVSREMRDRLLPASLKRWLRFNTVFYDTRKPPLDAESRQYLQEIFEPDIRKLEELLGRELPALRKSWTRSDTNPS